MKVVGIIAEYNPFHNGHKYQIDSIRKKTGADYIIVAMSGNFLQRGVPAFCDKYTRTRMALTCGADLVLELPTLWASASAEYFAKGGVTLLANTGVVTHLGFGAENDALTTMQTIASLLNEEPDEYKQALNVALKEGKSFPQARTQALLSTLSSDADSSINIEKITQLLNFPNNILALEYLKALPATIEPILIPRKGAGYHDTDMDSILPSASAIREYITRSSADFKDKQLDNAIPTVIYNIFQDIVQRNAYLTTNDLTEILGFCLLTLRQNGYAQYLDCNEELSNKIQKNLSNYTSFDSFCQSLKSKDLTYTRISRCLLHILLGITTADAKKAMHTNMAPYLRVLGFKKDASTLLTAIKKEANVPLITKVADAAALLHEDAYAIFEKDIYASSIYYQLLATKKGQAPANEYTQQIVIL